MIGLTASDILTSSGRHSQRLDWVSPAVERNAHNLAPLVTAVLLAFGETRRVNSGFRDVRSNAKVGGAPMSFHIFGQAVDLEDTMGKLGVWLLKNEKTLATYGLWAEHPDCTVTWAHLQSEPYQGWTPGSSRFFRWAGKKP